MTQDIRVASFIAGYQELYTVASKYPALRRVPIEHLDGVRVGLTRLGYNFRTRFRGPHKPQHDTLKKDATAFSIYFRD